MLTFTTLHILCAYQHIVIIKACGTAGSHGCVTNCVIIVFLCCFSNVQSESTNRLCVTIKPGLLLKGDILVKCYHKLFRAPTRDVIFRVQFHTGAIQDFPLTFEKKDLDVACLDERFHEHGKVEFRFSAVPKKVPDSEDLQNAAGVTVDYNTSDPLVRWDSYESFSSRRHDVTDGVPHTHGPLDGSVYAKVKKKSSCATVTRNGAAPGGGACGSGQHTRSMSTDSGNSTASTKTDRTERAPPSPYRGGGAGGLRSAGSIHTVPAQVHTSGGDGVDKAMVERETDILDDNTFGSGPSRADGHDEGSYMPNGTFTAKVSPAWSLPERAAIGITGPSIQRSTSAPVPQVHRCPPPPSQPEIEESIAQLNQLMLDLDPSFVPITAELEVPTRQTALASTVEDFRSQGAASAGSEEACSLSFPMPSISPSCSAPTSPQTVAQSISCIEETLNAVPAWSRETNRQSLPSSKNLASRSARLYTASRHSSESADTEMSVRNSPGSSHPGNKLPKQQSFSYVPVSCSDRTVGTSPFLGCNAEIGNPLLLNPKLGLGLTSPQLKRRTPSSTSQSFPVSQTTSSPAQPLPTPSLATGFASDPSDPFELTRVGAGAEECSVDGIVAQRVSGHRGFSRDPTAVSTSLRYRSASVDRCGDNRSDSYGRNAVDPRNLSHLPSVPRHSHQSQQIMMPQKQEADMSMWPNISSGHVVENVERSISSPDGGFRSIIGITSPNTPAFPLSSLTPYSSPNLRNYSNILQSSPTDDYTSVSQPFCTQAQLGTSPASPPSPLSATSFTLVPERSQMASGHSSMSPDHQMGNPLPISSFGASGLMAGHMPSSTGSDSFSGPSAAAIGGQCGAGFLPQPPQGPEASLGAPLAERYQDSQWMNRHLTSIVGAPSLSPLAQRRVAQNGNGVSVSSLASVRDMHTKPYLPTSTPVHVQMAEHHHGESTPAFNRGDGRGSPVINEGFITSCGSVGEVRFTQASYSMTLSNGHISSPFVNPISIFSSTFANQGSVSSLSGDMCPETHDNAKFVQDTSKYWYKPDMSRDQGLCSCQYFIMKKKTQNT
uniref:C2 tensin-type domain-containing protein n=1 Tax=Eptatretus burgeri TaxID=7764 RepID=A0A8C4QQP6_EPTBU